MIALSRIAAMGIAIAAAMAPVTAHADTDAAPDIGYRVTSSEHTVVATLSHGRFVLDQDNDTFTVLDYDGAPVMIVPTRFTVGDRTLVAAGAISADATELRLTAQGSEPSEGPVAHPVASVLENQAALNEFSTRFGLATAIGTLLGTTVGLAIGAVAGCVLLLPLFAVGCIPAAVMGAGLGGILGTIVVGGPVMILSAMELVNTLSAPAGQSKWSEIAPQQSLN